MVVGACCRPCANAVQRELESGEHSNRLQAAAGYRAASNKRMNSYSVEVLRIHCPAAVVATYTALPWRQRASNQQCQKHLAHGATPIFENKDVRVPNVSSPATLILALTFTMTADRRCQLAYG